MQEITINQETLVEAVQMYLNSRFRDDATVRVRAVSEVQYSEGQQFTVLLAGVDE